MKTLIYIKKEIKSIADLPEKEMPYLGKDEKGIHWIGYYPTTAEIFEYQKEHWINLVNWYLQPIELELPDDEEMNNKANNYGRLVKESITPDYGAEENASVEENASLDFLRGSNWLRDKIVEQLNIKQ